MTNQRIGIVGGYGRVGLETAQYLVKTTDYDIMIGGRSIRKADETATNLGARVSARMVDIDDQSALDAFCRECGLVINCAGPSWRVLDRVAIAALRQGVHYVDPGGYDLLYDALADKQGKLEEKGLTFIMGAGLLPGLSGLFPSHIAQSRFDHVKYLEIYYVGHDRWTFNSAYDIAGSLEDPGNRGMAYYKNGEMKKAGLFSLSKKLVLPTPIGKIRVFMIFTQELKSVIETNGIETAYAYGTNSGRRVPMVMAYIKIFKQNRTHEQRLLSANLIVKAAEKDMRKKDPCFMVHTIMEGEKDGRQKKLTATLSFKDTYKPTGIVAANTARFVMEGAVTEPGRFFLAESVDAQLFMAALEQEGYCPSYE